MKKKQSKKKPGKKGEGRVSRPKGRDPDKSPRRKSGKRAGIPSPKDESKIEDVEILRK